MSREHGAARCATFTACLLTACHSGDEPPLAGTNYENANLEESDRLHDKRVPHSLRRRLTLPIIEL